LVAHGFPLITTLAAAFGLSLLLGLLASRLKIPALVGYLLAGVLIGPFTPGFVADTEIATQLAEIGVMLLMFGVGLHFSFEDLLEVRKIAVPGAMLQILVATLLGVMVSSAWGWDLASSLIFGLALSVASTVVLLRALESEGILDSINGRIAVGWLVVEDLVMVIVLVLLPPLAALINEDTAISGSAAPWQIVLVTVAKVAVFITLMLVVGRRFFPKLLWWVARSGSRELFTLCIVAAAVSIAYGAAALFGVSFALGAFFAGMMLKESKLCDKVAENALPFQDAFAVLFFVAVGMLFDPMVLVNNTVEVLVVVLIIIVGKSLISFFIVLAFRYPLDTALMVSASLAQIGEFSFILMGLGITYNLVSIEIHSLVLAGALISITLNPFIFKAITPINRYLSKRYKPSKQSEEELFSITEEIQTTKEKVILVGFGRVGKHICRNFFDSNYKLVVIDKNRERISELHELGVTSIVGDATNSEFLKSIKLEKAKAIIIALPTAFEARQIAAIAKKLNPNIKIIVRATNDEEYEYYLKSGVDLCVMGERETAKQMSDFIIKKESIV
jgi:CPA2 family monovalent cation:H+ antiporter-2